jgi:uncharacterized Zn-finger protein
MAGAAAQPKEKIIPVRREELPLCCPNRKTESAELHPRVYLSLKSGVATCPYCGARYQLAD